MIDIELFSCAGGMGEGFRRAGIVFDLAFDFAPAHCDSYEKNLGHRPICMDVRQLLEMVRAGWRAEIRLLVADPPCTPWSRAGKRKGTEDDRDMLVDTCELIRRLRPQRYLIGNVPGLDDAPNWHIVQRVIGSLGAEGYCCADFAALDAANYGVPQHRIRPFWFGHLDGPCIQWPAPTHADPDHAAHPSLPGIAPLLPWVSCREALGHLPPDELGRPVNLRRRDCNSDQHGSVLDKPARVVGTSSLSDGNVIVEHPAQARGQITAFGDHHKPSVADRPARSITRNTHGDGTVLINDRHMPSAADQPKPAPVVTAKEDRVKTGLALEMESGQKKRRGSTQGAQWSRVGAVDAPAPTVLTDTDRATGNGVKIEWPWPRPSTTIQRDERIPPPGHHDENWDGGTRSMPGAVILSEKAAAILQGFPEDWHFAGKSKRERWSQIGQAMPPPLAHAVGGAVAAQMRASGLFDDEPKPGGLPAWTRRSTR